MRYVILFVWIGLIVYGSDTLENNCIACHKAQKIPSSMIYKKYLLKYSIKEDIQKAIYNYLKSPNPKTSIMPKPFFDKFPMKAPNRLDDSTLKEMIKLYIDKYDLSKKLVLED